MKGSDASWPLYRIDGQAQSHQLGTLWQLGAGGFHFDGGDARPALRNRDSMPGRLPGLPWFLHDLRPQGFAGRAHARRIAAEADVPSDPQLWSDRHRLTDLLDQGSSGIGDVVVGDRARDEALRDAAAPIRVVDRSTRKAVYPILAAAALRSEAVGAPVAGQQPKFAITVRNSDGHVPVVVKFSDRTATPAGRRWADLLIGEHHAGEVLHRNAVPAARSELIEADARLFLESVRFDRTRVLGRRGVVSLAALDAAFHGHGRIDWRSYAAVLQVDGWIEASDAQRLRTIAWFGDLIANADMHLGNASLYLADERPLVLAPVYDMLPMRFRPSRNGAVIEHRYAIALPTPDSLDDWRPAARMATDFWCAVAGDALVSAAFRAIAADALRTIERARSHLGA